MLAEMAYKMAYKMCYSRLCVLATLLKKGKQENRKMKTSFEVWTPVVVMKPEERCGGLAIHQII